MKLINHLNSIKEQTEKNLDNNINIGIQKAKLFVVPEFNFKKS